MPKNTITITAAQFLEQLSELGCERPAAIYTWCDLAVCANNLSDDDSGIYSNFALHGTVAINDADECALLNKLFDGEIPAILFTDIWDT